MHALVTGGAGFIGSTLVDRLLNEGHSVTVVDNLASGNMANLKDAQATGRLVFRELDVRDAGLIDVVAEQPPEVVFHLAAQADVRVSVARPLFDADVNVMGGLNVIEAARLSGARKIVVASSGGTIYGEPEPSALPVDESHSQHPVSPYGVAKKVIDDYLFAFGVLHGTDWASMALANVYGPRQDPHGEAGVVAIFAGKLLANEQCTIFGTGEQTRDFVYVDDVVDAFYKAAFAGTQRRFNIGTGVETSVNTLYNTMAEAIDVKTAPVYAPARVGELARSSLSPKRAETELQWQPATSLADGCRRVMEWFAQR